MLSGPRIGTESGMYNVGLVPKKGCTNDIDGIVPASSTDTLSRAQSSWFCSLPASLLARRDTPLTTSMKACVSDFPQAHGLYK